MFKRSGLLTLGALLVCYSCASGGSGGSDTTSSDVGAAPINTYLDEGAVQDTGLLVPPGTDNGTTTVEPPNPENCDYSGIELVQQSAASQMQGQFIQYAGSTSSAPPFDSVGIEIYQSAEFGGPTAPGTYSVDGTNYEDCGLCVRVFKNLKQSGEPEKQFYADKGTLTITSIGDDGRLTGTFDSIELKEVTIDTTTFKSTPVPGGETWCLSNLPFDAAIQAEGGGTTPTGDLPVGDASLTQATCVPDGNGHWVNSNVKDFTLTNCNGDPVSLHGLGCDGGATKAVHLISTAGWCSACKSLIAQVKNQYSPGDQLTQADIDAAVPGYKLLIILAENAAQGMPTPQYCKQYAAADGVDPAMIVIDNNAAGVYVPLAAPQGSGFTSDSLATTWTSINPYLVADSQGQIMSGFPWEAVLRASNMEYVWSSFYDQTVGAGTSINMLLSE